MSDATGDNPFPKDSAFKQEAERQKQRNRDLGLRLWNLDADPYDHAQLAENFKKIDQHDMGKAAFEAKQAAERKEANRNQLSTLLDDIEIALSRGQLTSAQQLLRDAQDLVTYSL